MDDVWLARRSEREGREDATSRDAAEAARGFNGTGTDSQYQRDRARIIHGASFRSLQSKTQVLGLGESDFYRTRLTHSLEVAQIGSGICEWLRERSTLGAEERALVPSFSLIEAVCLAHDIGHAPFGHGGEVAMNAMMREHGGFEANAQTLRIVARLGEYSASCGLDLTRRTMLGTVKYPTLYSAASRYPPSSTSQGDDSPPERFADDDPVPLNIDRWAPPKCLYDNEADVLDWLLEPFDENDRHRFTELEEPAEPAASGHRRSRHKPFDASIMELADDIAYGIHDLEDMLALGLVERDAWDGEVSGIIRALPDNPVRAALDELDRDLFDGSAKARKHAVSRLVGYLIRTHRRAPPGAVRASAARSRGIHGASRAPHPDADQGFRDGTRHPAPGAADAAVQGAARRGAAVLDLRGEPEAAPAASGVRRLRARGTTAPSPITSRR